MKIRLLLVLAATFALAACQVKGGRKVARNESAGSVCSDECTARSKSGDLACKLTTPELQERKATVLASLRGQIIEKKELRDGYAFKFPGSDKMLDELTEFIKTERECCDFFTFNLSISGDKSEAWLELTGAKGAKDFISTELGL
jgi:hypothetical protein